jgi:hypothetical protein
MGTTIAHLAGRNTRASQAEVCVSDNGNAQLSIDIATHDRVRLFSHFSAKREDSSFSKVLASYEAIGEDHERSRMTALLKT